LIYILQINFKHSSTLANEQIYNNAYSIHVYMTEYAQKI